MYINDMSPNEIEAYAKTVQEPERSTFFSLLTQEFELTDNPAKRNSLAMLLADNAKEMALEPIIRMIKNPKAHNSRGTLLYALNDLDYDDHLEYLFTLIYDDSFEVKREAFMLIEKAFEHKNISDDIIKRQISLAVNAVKQLQSDMDFYVSVLELLSK